MRERSTEILFVPKIMIIPLLLSFSWNLIAYYGSRVLTTDWHHINAEIFIDHKIPFVPWTVSIYLSCYLFWIANYIIGSRQNREEAFRLISADLFAKTICLLCFLIIPTTNTRPAVSGEGIWNYLMNYVYKSDAADNLFPSIHCLTSWFCYIAVRKNKNISKPYVIFSLLYAVSVCISTLTTKQHVIVDVIGGVGLAEGSYFIVKYGFAGIYEKLFTKLNKRLNLD
nr:phosphatase PAP2 family protein [uncultured Catonella sp.]